jgi:hypothetical protein
MCSLITALIQTALDMGASTSMLSRLLRMHHSHSCNTPLG